MRVGIARRETPPRVRHPRRRARDGSRAAPAAHAPHGTRVRVGRATSRGRVTPRCRRGACEIALRQARASRRRRRRSSRRGRRRGFHRRQERGRRGGRSRVRRWVGRAGVVGRSRGGGTITSPTRRVGRDSTRRREKREKRETRRRRRRVRRETRRAPSTVRHGIRGEDDAGDAGRYGRKRDRGWRGSRGDARRDVVGASRGGARAPRGTPLARVRHPSRARRERRR